MIGTAFHVDPDPPLPIVPVQDSVLVDQLALEGANVWVSHVPAAGLLTSKVISTSEPDGNALPIVVPELFLTVSVPEDWLLLNR